MKYLVDKKTKEHRPYYGGSLEWAEDQGLEIVRADSEGWIKHEGYECPLPDDCMVDTMWDDGQCAPRMAAAHWKWLDPSITHYRPILAEKAQEPEYDPRSVSFNLLDRLKAAHKAAQQIPDLEKELREVLAGMGYTLGKLSPFVERPSIKTMTCDWQAGLVATEPTEDMSDWRNWREGDDLMCVKGGVDLKEEKIYPIATRLSELCVIDDHGCQRLLVRINHLFRFHSRPEKGE